MIVLDTSVLVDSLSGPKRSARLMRRALEEGERLLVPTLVLYEWLTGPRREAELAAQQALFPSESVVPFGPAEATKAAFLYRSMRRPRGREIDIAIAASAISRGVPLWTLNARDFDDVPGLSLYNPPSQSID